MCIHSIVRSALVSSQLEEFLDSMAGECDEKALRAIKAKEIFYLVWLACICVLIGVSLSKHHTYHVVLHDLCL